MNLFHNSMQIIEEDWAIEHNNNFVKMLAGLSEVHIDLWCPLLDRILQVWFSPYEKDLKMGIN